MNYMESIANKLYIEGKKRGIHKITDKTQWRECVMADNLGHKVHEKISAGANAAGVCAAIAGDAVGATAGWPGVAATAATDG